MNNCDVIIAGAGIIGISSALELHERGLRVLVLDRAEPGREASSAAAGMLGPVDLETPPGLQSIARESALLYPDYVRKIEADAGMNVDFSRQGTIALLEEDGQFPEHRPLSSGDLSALEPGLVTHGHSAFFLKEDCVDPDLLMQAALRAAHARGVQVQGNTKVFGYKPFESQIRVATSSGELTARSFINCMGAWSGVPVRPRKGQMLYLWPKEKGVLRHVVRAPGAYIVPRPSGKILIGATVEDTGFDTTVVPSTISGLHAAASRFVPALGDAEIVQSWAGLRPGTPDDLPVIGPTEAPGAFIASGHFRNGILLAPVTAKIMADLVTGRPVSTNLSPFSPSRFKAARA